MQFCRQMGSSSCAKSTLAGVWADTIPTYSDTHNDVCTTLNPHIAPLQENWCRIPSRRFNPESRYSPFRVSEFYIYCASCGANFGNSGSKGAGEGTSST